MENREEAAVSVLQLSLRVLFTLLLGQRLLDGTLAVGAEARVKRGTHLNLSSGPNTVLLVCYCLTHRILLSRVIVITYLGQPAYVHNFGRVHLLHRRDRRLGLQLALLAVLLALPELLSLYLHLQQFLVCAANDRLPPC